VEGDDKPDLNESNCVL